VANIPVISIVAKANTGKTTLLEGVIRELKKRGIRLAVIKHHRGDFEIDQPGKDTWRHAQAGADVVVISAPGKMAMIEKRAQELSLDEIIARISGVDLIITEGYKKENKAKIEVFRAAAGHRGLVSPESDLVAIVSDVPWDLNVPCYPLDDFPGVADEIQNFMRRQQEPMEDQYA